MSPFSPKPRSKSKFSGIQRKLKRVEGEGPVPAEVMLIGERPGKHEAEEGRPFVGTSGQILNKCIDNAGLDRSLIYLTNLVKEYKDYEKPTAEEIATGGDEVRSEIRCVDPRVIATLGTYATEWLLDRDRAGLDKSHGVPVRIPSGPESRHSYRLVIPCYHPAAGLYSSENLALTGADLISVAMALEGSLTPIEDIFPDPDYKLDDHPDSGLGQVAVDTEGSKRRPWCLTYSSSPGSARLIRPGHSPQFLRKIWLHNSLHDLGVLRAMGSPVADGQFTDTMVLAYLLCLEPQGLKALAYRHAGMEMASYDEIIRDADRVKAMEYLLTVEAYADEWPEAAQYTVVEGGIAKVKKPHSISQRVRRILSDVESKGDDVDPRARWSKIDDWIKSPVIERLGEMGEATLDDVPYDDAVTYACRDADATLRIAPVLEAKIDEMGLRGVSDIDHSIIPMIDRMQEVGIQLAPVEFWDRIEGICERQMGQAKLGIYKATGAEINPDSGDQVADLLYDQLEIKAPWATKGGKRGSTIDKALETIRERRDVVDLVLDYREASKVVSSFVNPLRRIVSSPESDGRVHPTFRITRVSSGRLAATNLNLLAIPVRSELGGQIRQGFTAGDGYILGDWDLDQIEMRVMADESRDPVLIKLFNGGKVDIHRQTAAWTFNVPYDQVLTEQRYAAKRVGFGVITGITGHGLVDQMNLARARRPDGEPWTEDDCDSMIEAWFQIYKAVKPYMNRCGDEAYATGMARDRWGRIRYLPAVWSPLPWVADEARRQAHSHKIQAGAQGLMKRAMAQIWEIVCKVGWTEPLLQVHDSIMLGVRRDPDHMEFVSTMVVHLLTETTKLCVPVKAKGAYGENWAECKD